MDLAGRVWTLQQAVSWSEDRGECRQREHRFRTEREETEEEQMWRRDVLCAGVQQIYDVLSTLTAGGSSKDLLLLEIVGMDACVAPRSGWLVSRYR